MQHFSLISSLLCSSADSRGWSWNRNKFLQKLLIGFKIASKMENTLFTNHHPSVLHTIPVCDTVDYGVQKGGWPRENIGCHVEPAQGRGRHGVKWGQHCPGHEAHQEGDKQPGEGPCDPPFPELEIGQIYVFNIKYFLPWCALQLSSGLSPQKIQL